MPDGRGKPRARGAMLTLFVANAISMTGNQLAVSAVPWFVLVTTGSAAQTGVTAFFTILPVVLAAFFGGTLVDRLGYKRTSILADVASGVTIALIPILFAFGLLPFWLLLVLVFLGGLLDAPGTTAREALIPELASQADMSLERASSILQVVERGARLVGAPLGGVLIGILGPQNVLWVDAATFGLSAVMVTIVVPQSKRVPRSKLTTYRRELVEGLHFIHKDRLTRVLVCLLVITNCLDAAKSSVLLPVVAREVYGSAVALGFMFGISGGGAVIGALTYSAIGANYGRRWIFIAGFITLSMPILVIATLPPLPVVLVAQAIGGFAAGPLNPILSTLQYERVPATMRGRVFGIITASAFAAMPLGVLITGYLVELVDVQVALTVIGGCYMLTTVSLLFMPTLREMDHKVPQQALLRSN